MTTQTTCIVIGDPHFKISNMIEVDIFIEKLIKLCIEKKPNFIAMQGDLLDQHEKIHSIPLNKSYEFIDKLRKIAPTYCLVGNHDMYNNSQFLNKNHWMNGMNEWENVTIVDKVIHRKIGNHNFVFCPYVAPGRFVEALDSILDTYNWKEANTIFAHQEFYGCKMGAIVSDCGDKWPKNYPYVISGHIHSNQTLDNVYYPGASLQQAFGESDKNIIPFISFYEKDYVGDVDNNVYKLEEIDLELSRKKIIYTDIEHAEKYTIDIKNDDKIKLSISGSQEEFKSFRKTEKYKDLTQKGVKIVFKPKRVDLKEIKENLENNIKNQITDDTKFINILTNLIHSQKNKILFKDYEYIINNRNINEDDVMFLQ